MNSHIHQRLREEKAQILDESYPAQPAIDPIHKDAIWYGSVNYGCWIINDSKKRFALAEQVPFGDNNMSSKNTHLLFLYMTMVQKKVSGTICVGT